MKIYGDVLSGNCYKLKLICALLNIPHEWIHTDIMKGETRTRAFLAMNPVGKVPTVQLDDGRYLWESNTILNYLAHGSAFLPTEPFDLAKVQQWQFWEQYSHEPYIAVARFWMMFAPKEKLREKEHLIPEWHARGNAALAVMEDQLRKNDWFVAGHYSLADIALYAYTHCAEDGGFNLRKYHAVSAWLDRVAQTKNHVRMGAKAA